MEDEDLMGAVVHLINNDMENLETNLGMIRDKKDKELFAKYYNQMMGKTDDPEIGSPPQSGPEQL
jgi:hypothetical protein